MEDLMMRDKIEFTKKLVKEAGENIRKLMENKIEIETKANHADFVTNVDKQTEIFIVEAIKKTYDNQDFLTEENTTPRHESDDLWIIDPIDGTTNFIFQQKNFAISVAFYHQRKAIFGIVYDVMADKMFVGIQGEGAFLNDKKIEMTDQNRPLKQSLMYGDLYSLTLFPKGTEHLRQQLVSHRYLGAASIEICMVAERLSQAYISKNLKVWDVAAAVIVLKEAGGTFFFGGHEDDIYYNDEDGVFISSQNTHIKSSLQKLMDPQALSEIIQ